jgi:hypothetical protein
MQYLDTLFVYEFRKISYTSDFSPKEYDLGRERPQTDTQLPPILFLSRRSTLCLDFYKYMSTFYKHFIYFMPVHYRKDCIHMFQMYILL